MGKIYRHIIRSTENLHHHPRFGECPLCGESQARYRYPTSHGNIYECIVCGLFFRYPQPDEAALAEFYRESYKPSNIQEGKTRMAGKPVVLAQIAQYLETEFGPLKVKSLLDFGCGLGTAGRQFLLEYGMNVVGIEPDPVACEYVNNQNLFKVYKDIQELKETEADRRFDIIFLEQVIEHLREPWRELKELSKLLCETGIIYISTCNANGLNARITRGKWREILRPTHLYWFNYRSLRHAGMRANLDVTRLYWNITYTNSLLSGTFQDILQRLHLDGVLRIVARKRKA